MPEPAALPRIAAAAAVYAAGVFALGFVLGTFRVLWLAPRLGEVPAVLAEVPVVLCLSWVLAGRVLRHWPLEGPGKRAGMGALAFLLLMALEIELGILGFGRSLSAILTAMGTPAGMVGLAGQAGFALIPALRQRAG